MKEISELLEGFFDKSFIREGEKYLSLKSGWTDVVGMDVSSHTEIEDIQDSVLIVFSDHPGWAQMLQWKKKSLIKILKTKYPSLEIRDIRVIFKDGKGNISETKESGYRPKQMEIQKKEVIRDDDFNRMLETFKKRSES